MRVLIVDDHPLMRDGLRVALGCKDDIEVVGEAGSGQEAITLVNKLCPDVVTMDVSMADMNGIEATEQIRAVRKDQVILGLSVHSSPSIVRAMMKAGANGFVTKDKGVGEIVNAVRCVGKGEQYLTRELSRALRDHDNGNGDAVPKEAEALSVRETRLLALVGQGLSVKEIASAQGLSPKTVDKYRRELMYKLGLVSPAELMRYALREGFATLDN